MIRGILLSVAICGLLFGCSNNRNQNADREDKQIQPIGQAQHKPEVVLPSNTGIVKVELTDGKGSVEVQKNENESVFLEFSVEGYKKLSAHLSSPDSAANIRISQIIMPGGKMDGPWGRDMEYDLPMDGTYKLSIHENMMAGDPWSGVFRAEIELTK